MGRKQWQCPSDLCGLKEAVSGTATVMSSRVGYHKAHEAFVPLLNIIIKINLPLKKGEGIM